jgi:hypothetical protein
MYYNFGRVHQTLRVTPAMEAGIAVGLIRFRGHFPKEGYDVHDVHDTGQAGAPAL